MKVIVKQGCLYPNPGDPDQTIAVESAVWFNWLVESDRFIYEGEHGRFTARREVQRGNYYWYGYCRRKGKLHKTYLGKASDLTLDKLSAANRKLNGREEAGKSSEATFSLDLETSLRTAVADAPPKEEAAAANIPFTVMTRLIPPTLPANLVARPRLMQQIKTPITLITAPSGFGKTTLLSQWRHHFGLDTNLEDSFENRKSKIQNPKVAWVSLEAEERNANTFWMTIVTALQQINVTIGATVSTLLQSSVRPPIEHILASLIHNLNRWQAARPDRKAALIIDNYQRVQSPAIDAACQFFLDHLPPAVQVIMASQAEFPFAIHLWRAKGILTELSRDDLRLTPEEGVAWLDRAVSIPLTAREKLSLAVRAGGWAAGLNLLTLALKRQDDVHRFIATFDGHHPFLQDYFVEEILRKHPADQQAFLLQTSILKNLTGALCDAVTDRSDSEQILQQLYRANQFIVLADKTQGWYQYHDLFAQALQKQLQQHTAWQIPDLHRRAAAWYQENGLYSEVIRHLLRAGDWPELGQIIEQVVLDELRRGSDDRVLRWFQQLPDELFLRHDTLLLTYTRLATPSLPEGQVKTLLHRITARIEALPTAAQTSAQQALLARLNEWERTVARGRSPQPPAPDARDIEQVGYLLDLYYQGLCLQRQGDIKASKAVLEQALELGQAQRLVYIILAAGGVQANLMATQGRLSEAATLARAILQSALGQTGVLPSCASIPLAVLSKIYYTRNQLAQARQFIEDGVIVDPNPTSLNMVFNQHALLAQIFDAEGDKPASRTTLQAALELEPYATHAVTVQDLKAIQGLLYVRQGRATQAEQHLRRISDYPLPAHQARDGLLKIAWAELFLAQQQYEEAEAILTQPGKTSIHWFLFNIWPYTNLLLALAYWGQHKFGLARREMIRAVRMAEPEGIIRPFLDCGDSIIPLLTDLRQAKKLSRLHRRFVSQLIEQFHTAHPDLSIPSAEEMAEPVPVQLSPREREVLQLLDEGLDNKALAHRLAVADNTVRSHLRNIYRKLEVNSRIQAVKRGRELGLL